MNPVISFVLCSQYTPLHCCCYGNGSLKVCKLLVRSKADVAATDEYRSLQRALSSRPTHSLPCSQGHTPLWAAIDENNSEVADYLRSIGAPEASSAPALTPASVLRRASRPPTSARRKVLVQSSQRVIFGLLLHEFTRPRPFAGCRGCPNSRRTRHSSCCTRW